MSVTEVRKHKNTIFDRYNNVRYVIYSNKKLNKRQMMRQIRYYYYDTDNPLPMPGSTVNIVSGQ